MARKDYYNSEREQTLRDSDEIARKRINLDMADDLSKVNLIYLNPAQRAVYNFGCRTTYVEAGRGVGKTNGMLAPYTIRCVKSMPRGSGLFLGVSVKQLLGKTAPELIKAIEQMTGLKEGVHFFRGHAPAKCKFKEPIVKPRIWDNCIHYWNGYVDYMISTSVKASANGINSCSVKGDEGRFMPESVIMESIMPSLRGVNINHPGFNEELNPFFKSVMFVSDAPLTRRQEWMRRHKEDQTIEINKKIAALLTEANEYPWIIQLPKFQKELNNLRCQASIFFSFSSFENFDLLLESYFRDMERKLTPTMFNISIRNLEKERINDGYYTNLNIEDVHGYINDDEDQIQASQKFNERTITQMYSGGRTLRIEHESVNLQALSKEGGCLLDTDILPGEPLRIGIDYNANINCIVTGQTGVRGDSTKLKILSSMTYTKADRLEGLCRKWCKYYEVHKSSCRDVIFYYDSTARQGAAYASEKYDETRYHNIVRKELKKHGWNVIEVQMGRPMSHNKKYEFINGCLAGTQRPYIRINKENNENLIASMENAGLIQGRNGFEKDKSKEKYRTATDCEDPEAELARRTDLSDAFDTLVIGVRFYGAGRMIGVSMPILG